MIINHLGSVMTLLNLIPVFCYVLSAIFLGEHLSIFRVGAVLLTIGGAVGITLEDMANDPLMSDESHWVGGMNYYYYYYYYSFRLCIISYFYALTLLLILIDSQDVAIVVSAFLWAILDTASKGISM
jgi:drug/metabolite transporter (DMT)-like permease